MGRRYAPRQIRRKAQDDEIWRPTEWFFKDIFPAMHWQESNKCQLVRYFLNETDAVGGGRNGATIYAPFQMPTPRNNSPVTLSLPERLYS